MTNTTTTGTPADRQAAAVADQFRATGWDVTITCPDCGPVTSPAAPG